MIPDCIRYGSPEECQEAIAGAMRWRFDPRWRWPETPELLPTGELRAIDVPLLSKRITRYNERQANR